MNYCSIQDAWGSSDYITDQFKKYDSANNVENFDSIIKNNTENNTENNLEKTITVTKIDYTCDDFFNHHEQCLHCKNRMQNRYSSKIIERIGIFINENKDNIILCLIILFIFIFIKLLFSIFTQ